jgi:hypothetical protein
MNALRRFRTQRLRSRFALVEMRDHVRALCGKCANNSRSDSSRPARDENSRILQIADLYLLKSMHGISSEWINMSGAYAAALRVLDEENDYIP